MAEEQTAAQGDLGPPNNVPDSPPAPVQTAMSPKEREENTEENNHPSIGDELPPAEARPPADPDAGAQDALGGAVSIANARETLSGLSLEHPLDAPVEALGLEAELPQNDFMTDDAMNDAISIARSALASSMGDDSFPLPLDTADPDTQKIRAYAKIEFEDGQFYMTTYAVELGRDVRAAKRAMQRKLQREFVERERGRHGSHSSEELSHHRYAASSAVSESGGIVNYESTDRKRRTRSKNKGSVSPTSSSFSRSRHNSSNHPEPFDYQTRAYESIAKQTQDGPTPHDCPLIPVHPPVTADDRTTGYGGISRRHARVSYNFDRNWFQFEVLGRNGAFVDDQFVDNSQIAVLDHGSKIQIGGVSMTFLLPNQSEPGAGTTLHSEALSSMSFEFEDGRGESLPILDTSTSASSDEEESSKDPSPRKSASDDEDDSDDSDQSDSEEEDDDDERDRSGHKERSHRQHKHLGRKKAAQKPSAKHRSEGKMPKIKLKLGTDRKNKSKQEVREKGPKPKASAPPQDRNEDPRRDPDALKNIADKLGIEVDELPARRKGPGRPPKDGIMSKREYAQLARQQKERAKAEGLQNGTFKTSKPLNGVISSTGGGPRKYTKRKKEDEEGEDDEDVKESIEGGDTADGAGGASRSVKEKRPAKPPRSPSPVFDEATLTEEQLAKPPHSYVVLIHEALSNSATGQMSLPQIYRSIERRYPYFKLRVTTQGWQSSVRHNLSQHAAFRKIEKDGKGWMWGLVPEVSIEKEKKRRTTPPPSMSQPFYAPPHQPYRPDQYPYPPAVPPVANGQPQSLPQYPHAPLPAYVQAGASAGLGPPYGFPVIQNTYQSPYAPTPSAAPRPPAAGGSPDNDSQAAKDLYSQNYYSKYQAPASATAASPVGQAATTSPSPYPPPSAQIKPFVPKVKGVPSSVVDSCSKYKEILSQRLLATTPDIEQVIDSALDRAIRQILGLDEPGDHSGERPEDVTVFVDQARTMLENIWENPRQSLSAAQPTASPSDGQASPPDSTASAPTAPRTSNADGTGHAASNGTRSADAAVKNEPEAQTQGEGQSDRDSTGTQEAASAEHPTGNGTAGESSKPTSRTSGESHAPEQNLGGTATGLAKPARALSASREAIQKVMTTLNVGSKRSHPGADEEQAPLELGSEAQPEERPRAKRLAI